MKINKENEDTDLLAPLRWLALVLPVRAQSGITFLIIRKKPRLHICFISIKTLAVFSSITFYLNAFCNDRNVSLFLCLLGLGESSRHGAVGCRFNHFDIF